MSKKTEWWYCIKDTPFDSINLLKSDRRYKINKGKRNFDVKEINPLNFKKEIYEVQKYAFADYPEKYKPEIDKNKVYKSIENWNSNYRYLWSL